MIFERLGHFATRYRIPIIFAWIAAAVLITLLAPNLDDVTTSEQGDLLPDDAPSEHADDVYRAAFESEFSSESTIIVVDAEDAGGILNQDAETFEAQTDTTAGMFITQTVDWLTAGDDRPPSVASVNNPLDSPTTVDLMVGRHNQIALINVSLSTSSTDDDTTRTLEEIDEWLETNRPDDIKTYQTGATAIGNNTAESAVRTVDRTIWVTVVLVVILLLLIYRSPVSPLIPLFAVTMSYLITRGVVAYLGDTVMTLFTYTNVLLVVVLYGAGTDYCLFLISRFREEMADDIGLEPATRHTVHMVGETISSSAGTIFVGFMAMAFAEMGIFNTSGPALAIGIVIALLAGLTLVPALLATLGNHAFWPGKAQHRANGRLYEMTSKLVSSRPLLVVVVIVALMTPLSVYGVAQNPSYDLLADLPDDSSAVRGYDLMKEGLGPGNVMPLTVVVTERDPDTMAREIDILTAELAALDGVDDVQSLSSPLGQDGDINHLMRIDGQLRAMSLLFEQEFAAFENADQATIAEQGAELMQALEPIQRYFNLLVERFPETADEVQPVQELFQLGNLATVMSDPNALPAALGALDELATRFESVDEPYLTLAEINALFSAIPSGGDLDFFAELQAQYLNVADTAATSGDDTTIPTAYQITVLLADNPNSYDAMDTVDTIRAVLEPYAGDGDAVVSGSPAISTDIRDTINRDLLRAIGFVLLGIFIVLLVMLRSAVAPIYLIGTVVLSFTFTLGLTNLVFQTFSDVEGLTWYVPFFTFVFLVALGVDYSIFLFGRVKEEVGHHGVREGVHVAVATTGSIITSAGIILSGTFAAMMSGEIMGLAELGFAVAFGVLVDTFVVRTVLDPALAALFGRWTWWPGGIPQAQPRAGESSRPQPVPAPEPGD
ncbi:MAG: MMPL family transporter [Chloroflexi bacterium]|nr:MMPL family transporter [Chloroflexota bacterium]